MPHIKEKPTVGKTKAKSPARLIPKQAARLMKEKHLQKLERRRAEAVSETEYATDRVESSSLFVVDELSGIIHPHSVHRGAVPVQEKIKAEQSPSAPPHPSERTALKESVTHPRERQPASQHPQAPTKGNLVPREKPTLPAEQSVLSPKERPIHVPKTRKQEMIPHPDGAHPSTSASTTQILPSEQQTIPHIANQGNALPKQPSAKIPNSTPVLSSSTQPQKAARQFTLNNRRRGLSALHQPETSTGLRTAPKPPSQDNSSAKVMLPLKFQHQRFEVRPIPEYRTGP